jgi:hypothetical protein
MATSTVSFLNDATTTEDLFNSTTVVGRTIYWAISDGTTREQGTFSLMKDDGVPKLLTNFSSKDSFESETNYDVSVETNVNGSNYGIKFVGYGDGLKTMTFKYTVLGTIDV